MEWWMQDTSSVGDKTVHLLSHTFTKAMEDHVPEQSKVTLRTIPKKFKNWLDHDLNGNRQWCQIMLIL